MMSKMILSFFWVLMLFLMITWIEEIYAGEKKPGVPAPVLTGEYLGQKKPGLTPEIFAPGIISTEAYEFAGTFSPDGKEFYFTRRWPTNNTIWVTQQVNGQWTVPQVAHFSGKYFDFEPFITPDGKRLFWGSMRPIDSGGTPGGLHEWVLEKTAAGWSEPRPLEPPFKDRFVMYPTAASNGNIYFTGMNDKESFELLMSKKGPEGKYQEPVRLSQNINRFPYAAHPFIAPDESYLLFDAKTNLNEESDLYISFKKADGTWADPKNMGEPFNTPKEEMCASVSPDGKYLFFTRDGKIHWIDARIIKNYQEK